MASVSSTSSSPSLSVSAVESNKRLAQPKPPEQSDSNPDKVAEKKANEPRPTTNTQGQALGQRINATA